MRPSESLAKNLDAVRAIIARYPVSNPRVFGSVARGDDHEGSDVDLLVDSREGLTYFELAQLACELEKVVGAKFDIATPPAVKRIEQNISDDLRPLYSAQALPKSLVGFCTTARKAAKHNAHPHHQ
jgi:predicted nucleotidyltransferase